MVDFTKPPTRLAASPTTAALHDKAAAAASSPEAVATSADFSATTFPEAAKKLGISFTSMNRYIAAKKIPRPPLVEVAGIRARLWSDRDIEKVRAVLPKIKNGRKLRYKKETGKPQTGTRR
jgi:predicted DNA-binding transcriptional regulator AlpA